MPSCVGPPYSWKGAVERALEPPFGLRDDVIVMTYWWACPSYSGCDSEIEFPLYVGCKRRGVKLYSVGAPSYAICSSPLGIA